jgi:hypothetical protein
MTLSTLFSIWAIALTLALVSIAAIVRPLSTILVGICGSEDRARFWTAYTCVLTIIAPLMAVSTPRLLDVAAEGLNGPTLQHAVFFALAGIVAAFLCVGQAIWKPIASTFRAPAAFPVPPTVPVQPAAPMRSQS